MSTNCLNLCYIQGQCFVAVDPKAFSEGFEDRMQSLMDHCRNLQPVKPFYLASHAKKCTQLWFY